MIRRAEDFIKTTDVTEDQNFARTCPQIIFSPHYYMKENLIFELYLSQIIDQNY